MRYVLQARGELRGRPEAVNTHLNRLRQVSIKLFHLENRVGSAL